MTKTTAFLSCLLTILLLHSCTVEKRLYRPGFHVEWNKRYTSERVETEQVTKEQIVIHSSEVAFSDSTRQEQFAREEVRNLEQSNQDSTIQQQLAHSEEANQAEKVTYANRQTLTESVQKVKHYQHVVQIDKDIRRVVVLFFLISLLIIILFIVLAFIIGLDTFWGVFLLVIAVILLILFILAVIQ